MTQPLCQTSPTPSVVEAMSTPSQPAPNRHTPSSHPSQTKPSTTATLALWGTGHHNRLMVGSRTGAERGPVWTSPKRESAAQHLWVVPCAVGLWSRQRWLCSPVSCSEPGAWWPVQASGLLATPYSSSHAHPPVPMTVQLRKASRTHFTP